MRFRSLISICLFTVVFFAVCVFAASDSTSLVSTVADNISYVLTAVVSFLMAHFTIWLKKVLGAQ